MNAIKISQVHEYLVKYDIFEASTTFLTHDMMHDEHCFKRNAKIPANMTLITQIKIKKIAEESTPRATYDKLVSSWRATDKHCTR